VPASSDFHTPPLAAPTKTVILPDGSLIAAIADIRPLMVAEPMLRAPRPEIVAELNGACSAADAKPKAITETSNKIDNRIISNYFGVGKRNIASSIGTLASALAMIIFCLSGSPLRPESMAKGRKTPLTFS
jgi:hypothetical protein